MKFISFFFWFFLAILIVKTAYRFRLWTLFFSFKTVKYEFFFFSSEINWISIIFYNYRKRIKFDYNYAKKKYIFVHNFLLTTELLWYILDLVGARRGRISMFYNRNSVDDNCRVLKFSKNFNTNQFQAWKWF